jgi:four helix bundle protein
LQFKNKNYDIKHRSYFFSISIIKFLEKLPKSYICQTIGKQLLRSATSIGANIIEAQAGSSKRDFQNFINHALKGANETKYWLCLLRDGLKTKFSDIDKLLSEADELAKILGASVLRLKGRK